MLLLVCVATLFGFVVLGTAQTEPQDVTEQGERAIFICPLPKCKCPSKQRAAAPGIGFALELGHG